MPIERLRKFESTVFYPRSKMNARFCMATKAGGFVFLRGQTGFDFEGNFHGVGDAAAQAEQACKGIQALLGEAGATMQDVCKLTVYITDRAWREPVYAVIARHFRDVYPCSTGLIVDGLALPEMLVEIDVVAYVGP
jgi:enamine deaminase RidA (YjgF/YER057c/UK114 family)